MLVYGLQNEEYYIWSAPFLIFALVLAGLWFIERRILHLECAFLGFCACVGLWFIERGILHLECAFLGFCACVGLWFIERGINIMSSDRTDRTNRNALCPHVIMRCTLRMCSAYGP